MKPHMVNLAKSAKRRREPPVAVRAEALHTAARRMLLKEATP